MAVKISFSHSSVETKPGRSEQAKAIMETV